MKADDRLLPPALVLGGGYTGTGVVRCLGPAGITVLIAAPRSDFAVWSRWAERLKPALPESADPGPLAEALEQLAVLNPVLIPCSDLWCEAVARLPEAMNPGLPAVVGPWSAVEVMLDKWRLAEELERLGIPHPATFRVEGHSDLTALDDRPGRFILKPRRSQPFASAFGVKAFEVSTRADASEALDRAAGAGLKMILQEHVPGPADAHVLVDGLVDREGTVGACFVRRRRHVYPLDLGNSSSAASIPLDEAAGAVSDVKRLLRAVGYRGLFNAELKLDSRDGVFKLIEINCRAWWQVDFSARCGLNICLLAYRDAIGLPIDTPPKAYRTDQMHVLALPELKSLTGLRRTGELSITRWLLGCARTLGAIRHPDDPLPALVNLAQPLARLLRWGRDLATTRS